MLARFIFQMAVAPHTPQRREAAVSSVALCGICGNGLKAEIQAGRGGSCL